MPNAATRCLDYPVSNANGFVYNLQVASAPLGAIPLNSVTDIFVACDGISNSTDPLANPTSGAPSNICWGPLEVAARHGSSNMVDAVFVDGHVEAVTTPSNRFSQVFAFGQYYGPEHPTPVPETDYAYWIFPNNSLPAFPLASSAAKWKNSGQPTFSSSSWRAFNWGFPADSFTDPTGTVHTDTNSQPFVWWGDAASFSLTFCTTNMTAIKVTYGYSWFNSNANNLDTFEYSLNSGTTWVPFTVTMPANNNARITNDLSALTSINNQPSVTLRWRSSTGNVYESVQGVMVSSTYLPSY